MKKNKTGWTRQVELSEKRQNGWDKTNEKRQVTKRAVLKKILILQTMVLVIITSLTMILLYNFKGTSEHTLIICNSLGQYVPAKCDWWGPIAALNMDVSSFTSAGNNFEGTSIADGNNFFYIFCIFCKDF